MYGLAPKIWKSYRFRPILHEFDILFTLRTYVLNCEKDPTWIFGRACDTPLDIRVAPGGCLI